MNFYRLLDGQGCQYVATADSMEDLLKNIDKEKAHDGWIEAVLNGQITTDDDQQVLIGTLTAVRARRIYRVGELSSSQWLIKDKS